MSSKWSFGKPYYNVDASANTLALEEAFNVYFEDLPQGGFAIRRRPGLTLKHASTGSYGATVFWSDKREKLYYVVSGNVYVKDSYAGTPTLIGTIADNPIPVIQAEGQFIDLTHLIYLANGATLKYINSDDSALVTPSDPLTPSATFVANLNNRIFANSTVATEDQGFYITDVNLSGDSDPTYWSYASNPLIAAQKPDKIKGIYSGWNEAYVWGSQACEVWQEDGVTPVSPLIGSLIEAGLVAPYSVVACNNTMFGLASVNGKLCVVQFSGRNPRVLSEPIARNLQEIETVSDAIGSLCLVGGLNCYVLNFPSANQTWVYDFKSEVWSQWSHWNLASATHNMFLGAHQSVAKTWGKHFAMSILGDIYELSRDVFTDNGDPIKSSIRTGWIDHGTWNRKRSTRLRIKLKGKASENAMIILRFRDDGREEWSNDLELPVYFEDQADNHIEIPSMGIYRSRQYEFYMTDAADLALIGLEEDVERLRN